MSRAVRALRSASLASVWVYYSISMDLDGWQEEFLESAAKRKCLCCSRQSGKSTIAAAGALHRAKYQAGALILVISASQRQAQELFKKVQTFYQLLEDPPQVVKETSTEYEFTNGSRIVCLPAKAETVRGYSAASLVIVDEASHVEDGLLMTLRPMLAVSGGDLWIMSTPFGQRGFFYEIVNDIIEEEDELYQFKKWVVPVSGIPRIDPRFVASEKRWMPEAWFRQEYECSFEGMMGSVFRMEDILAAESDDVEPAEVDPFLEEEDPVFATQSSWETMLK